MLILCGIEKYAGKCWFDRKQRWQSALQAENRGPENTIFVETCPKTSNMRLICCAMTRWTTFASTSCSEKLILVDKKLPEQLDHASRVLKEVWSSAWGSGYARSGSGFINEKSQNLWSPTERATSETPKEIHPGDQWQMDGQVTDTTVFCWAVSNPNISV